MQRPRPRAPKSKRSKLLKSALISSAIAWTACLSGCAPAQITGTAAQICQDWRTVGVRKADAITDDTAKEIIGNNEARAVWCQQKKA